MQIRSSSPFFTFAPMARKNMNRRPISFSIALLFFVIAAFSCGPEQELDPAPVLCEEIDDRMSCQAAEECGWLIQSCGDEVEASCLPQADASVSENCRALEIQECHEQESLATCAPEACRWVSPGCGDENDYPLEGATCVPQMQCTPDEEDQCPEGLECYPFTWDPCAGSDCDACGAHEYSCFPTIAE